MEIWKIVEPFSFPRRQKRQSIAANKFRALSILINLQRRKRQRQTLIFLEAPSSSLPNEIAKLW